MRPIQIAVLPTDQRRLRRPHLFIGVVAAMIAAPALSASDPALTEQRDRQAQVLAETEQLARRVGTMLRILDHYKLDTTEEKKLLDEAAATLTGLSQQQMTAVLSKLEAAMHAADEEAAKKNVSAAYDGHREALRRLRGLLGRFDALRDLDAAIQRFEKLAKDELELSFRVADVLQDSLDLSSLDANRRRRAIRAEFPTARARHDADEQADYCREFESMWRQLLAMRGRLHADDHARIADAEKSVIQSNLSAALLDLANHIRPEGTIENRHRDWVHAVESGWLAAGQLQAVAELLRPRREKVMVLSDARQMLVETIAALEKEMRESVEFFGKPPSEPVANIGMGRRLPPDPTSARARQHADASSRMGHAVRGIGYRVAAHSSAPANGMNRAAASLHLADQSFRQIAPLFARIFQVLADGQLRQALSELDVAIAQAVKERSDALAATNAALQLVEQLIKEQTHLRDETQQLVQAKNDDAAKKQALQQRDLARQGKELGDMPLPANPRTKALLKDAAKDMDAAADQLANRQPKPATDHQNEALAQLEEAKKDLQALAKKIEERRSEIAQLEESREKLNELAKEQKQVASDVYQSANQAKPGSDSVAQRQERVIPPTQDVSDKLQPVAKNAAESTQRALDEMKAAKDSLQKNQPAEAAQPAERAAEELDRAGKQVSKALADRRAQEAIDQAKMQPNQMDPAQAARDVAKAMDATSDAAQSSDEAQQSPIIKDLQQRQSKVAEQARQTEQSAAAEPASRAANELQRGEIAEAVKQQQQALRQLQKGEAKPTELAGEQKSIMDTTQALAKSMESTELAQSALQQAMAQAPEIVQHQLQQASKQLQQAGQQLQKAQPQQAHQAQDQARDAMEQAMQALQQAAELAKNQPSGQKPQPNQQQPDQQPGQQQSSPEAGEQVATGDRKPEGPNRNVKAHAGQVDGSGSFLNLPPRQRELIRQTLTEKLSPEYATLIQQYFVNLARGKAAAGRDAKPGERPPAPMPPQ